MARRNARPEPLSAIVLTFSNAAVAPCHARLNRPAPGGGRGGAPNRRIRVACCIAIVSFRATAEATSAKASVSTTKSVAQLAMAAGHEQGGRWRTRPTRTRPSRTRAPCAARERQATQVDHQEHGGVPDRGTSDRRGGRRRGNRRRRGTSERASVSARRPGARLRTKTPRTPVSSTSEASTPPPSGRWTGAPGSEDDADGVHALGGRSSADRAGVLVLGGGGSRARTERGGARGESGEGERSETFAARVPTRGLGFSSAVAARGPRGGGRGRTPGANGLELRMAAKDEASLGAECPYVDGSIIARGAGAGARRARARARARGRSRRALSPTPTRGVRTRGDATRRRRGRSTRAGRRSRRNPSSARVAVARRAGPAAAAAPSRSPASAPRRPAA